MHILFFVHVAAISSHLHFFKTTGSVFAKQYILFTGSDDFEFKKLSRVAGLVCKSWTRAVKRISWSGVISKDSTWLLYLERTHPLLLWLWFGIFCFCILGQQWSLQLMLEMISYMLAIACLNYTCYCSSKFLYLDFYEPACPMTPKNNYLSSKGKIWIEHLRVAFKGATDSFDLLN